MKVTEPAETPTEFADRVSNYFEEARQEAMSRTHRGDTIDARGILVEWEQDAEADGDVVGQNTARIARLLFCESERDVDPRRPLRDQLGQGRVDDGLGR